MDPVTLTLGKKYTRKKVVPAYATAMFNPAADVVYDSCYRDVTEPLDVYANDIKTDSGHGWIAVEGTDGRLPTLQYLSGGGLRASSSPTGQAGLTILPGISLLDYDPGSGFRYFSVRYGGLFTPNWLNYHFLHFVDDDNWIAVTTGNHDYSVRVCEDGVKTSLGTWMRTDGHYPSRNGGAIYADIRVVHALASESGRAVYASVDRTYTILVGLPATAVSLLDTPGKIGLAYSSATNIYSLRAGVSGGGM